VRNFIIDEEMLGAVCNCIGSAIHNVPFGQVQGLLNAVNKLPQVQMDGEGKLQTMPDPKSGAQRAQEAAEAAASAREPAGQQDTQSKGEAAQPVPGTPHPAEAAPAPAPSPVTEGA